MAVLGIISCALTIQFLLRTEILLRKCSVRGEGKKSLAELFLLQPFGGSILKSQTEAECLWSTMGRTEGSLFKCPIAVPWEKLVLLILVSILVLLTCIQLKKSWRQEREHRYSQWSPCTSNFNKQVFCFLNLLRMEQLGNGSRQTSHPSQY